jgi:putative membrane protein
MRAEENAMKKLILVLLCLAMAFISFACHKEENYNSATDTSATTTATDTYASTTSTTATDTSATTTTATSTAASTLGPDDTTFVNKAAQGGMAEVSLGQMASSKATNPDVKAFGDRMVSDHSKANDELKQLAQSKGVTVPADVDQESKNTADKLSKASGKEFDKAYMDDMVKDHEKDVKEFEKQSKDAKDPDLKAWVTKTLPTLQDHLKMAKETKAKLK